jgi:integrase/recombinase XerD
LSPKFIAANIIIELLKGFHNECERVMYHAQYDMGLRIGELVDLRISDLPREEHYDPACEFLPVCIRGNKGRAGRVKQRTTVISRAVLNRIKRYHNSLAYKLAENWQLSDKNKPVFLTPNGKAWSVRNASQQFKRSARRQRLDPKICTHWLRHGTAFSILRSDIGKSYEDRMLTVQQLLGHSRLSTTEIYTQISPAMLLSLTERGREINRLTEAEEIRDATFLGSNQHCEKRGHRV